MKRLFQAWSVNAFMVFCYVLAACIAWAALIDRQLPIANISGKIVSFDAAKQSGIVEWTGLKHRRCDGWRSGWMREDRPEPPPRVVEFLQPSRTPPVGFNHKPAEAGSVVTWRTDFTIPPTLQGQDVIYVARWEYACNPWQHFFPLVVDSPLVEIKQPKPPG